MNQKLAKKLRKIAAQMATAELTYFEKDNVKPEIRFLKEEQRYEIVQVKRQGTLTAHPGSARAIYRSLKKKAKRA
jgi:hypothetical protein